MGNKSSSYEEPRQSPAAMQSSSSSWNYYDNSQAPSSQDSQSYNYPPHRPVVPAYGPPQATYTAPQAGYSVPYPAPQDYNKGNSGHAPAPKKTLDKRYSRIADNYRSLEEVTEALASAGLESSNLIVGIDFTKSNEWTGKKSFSGKSLHHIGNGLNPYEQGISIIGRTLAAFDEDNLIPCFGFGDATTHDQDIFSFYPDERYCHGFEEVLRRYREIVPHLKLAGPTSFAPVIEMAMTIVEQSGGQYHVLVIIADGQVTRSVDTEYGQLSPQERRTVDAIVAASKLPLSIVLVGVGDGPWDMMKEFDDNLPAREFDNFQFVNFSEIMSKDLPQSRKETEFALAALMEVPSQYKATIELNLLGGRKGNAPGRVPLPPPVFGIPSFSAPEPSYTSSTSFQQSPISNYEHSTSHVDNAPSAPNAAYENQLCPICLTNPKDMAFGCGHQTCRDCGNELQLCPICRNPIQTRIKLY